MGKHVLGSNVPQLKILIIKAVGLPAADIGGTSDPYVQIQVGHDYGWNPKVWKTSKLKKTLNPIWNEEFIVPVASPEKDGVRLAVFDYDFIGSDDLLGQVVFPGLHKLPLGVPTEAVLTLTGLHSTRGTLHVIFTAMNFGMQGPTVVQTTTQAAPQTVAVQQTTTVASPPPQPVAVQQTTTTAGYNPYATAAPQPYGAPAPAYGAPPAAAAAPNPYGAPQQNYAIPNMYAAPMYPSANPYGQPQQQQPAYGAPPQGNPYGSPAPQGNPYGAPAPQGNPYGAPAPQGNPYGAPAPQGNPYGAPPQGNPYGAPPQGNPYGAPPAY